MTVAETLSQIQSIQLQNADIPVEQTAAEGIRQQLAPQAKVGAIEAHDAGTLTLRLGVITPDQAQAVDPRLSGLDEWQYVRISSSGDIELYVSHTWFLYRLASQLIDPHRE